MHWQHPMPWYPQTGEEVHLALRSQQGLSRLAGYADADFLAEIYLRAEESPRSVAQAEGLA
ncbi:MAG TPA: hypothetical protein VH637_03450 [Streptosporangiaceae bacterium]